MEDSFIERLLSARVPRCQVTERDFCPRCGSPFFFAHPGCPVCYKQSPLYHEPTILETYRATHRFDVKVTTEGKPKRAPGVSVR